MKETPSPRATSPWLIRRLTSRRAPLLLWLLGALACLPAALRGAANEDLLYRMIALHGIPGFPLRFNLWGTDAWVPEAERAAHVLWMKSVGVFPWLAADDFKVALFRPLASVTHHLDFRIATDLPFLWHLHDLAWWGALVFAAAATLRRLTGGPAWAPGLALSLYALDDAHGHALGWVMNRNAVMAAFFGVLSLSLHARAAAGSLRHRAGSVVAYAAALLSGEIGLGALGLLVAHALVLERGWSARARALAAPFAVTLAWGMLRAALGYGAQGSGEYLDPLGSPASFLRELPYRAVVLAAGAVLGPASDLALDRVGAMQLAWGALGLGGATAFVLWLRPVLRADPLARFWALGGALSVLPLAASFPQDRLLFLPTLASAALVARGVARAAERRSFRGPAALFLMVHGMVAPALLPLRALTMAGYEATLQGARERAYAEFAAGEHLVVINAPDHFFGSSLYLSRLASGLPAPDRVMVLAGHLEPVRVTRVDPNSVLVRPRGGFLLRSLSRLFRDASRPMVAGQQVLLPGLEVLVTEVDARGAPRAVRFRFDRPLEQRPLRWIAWCGDGYRAVAPPAVGTTLVVGAAGCGPARSEVGAPPEPW